MSHRTPRPVEELASWRDALAHDAAEMGLTLEPAIVDRFHHYAALLQKWGRRINLTSRLEPQEISSLHFLDSLALLAMRPPGPGSTLVDIGSGAGFPGLPLKLVRPDLSVVLLESTTRKAAFLEQVIGQLRLTGITVTRARAGEWRSGAAREFEWAVARAVAPLPTLLPLAAGLLRPGGILAAWKGPAEESPGTGPPEWDFDGKRVINIPGRSTPRSLLFYVRR